MPRFPKIGSIRVATRTGESEKSVKNGGFWKKSGNFFLKHKNLSVQIPYI